VLSETTTTDTQDEVVAEENSEATESTETAEADQTQTQTDQDGAAESADEADAEAEARAKQASLDWLTKKANIDPGDPDALQKVAEVWHKADEGFHQSRQDRRTLQQQLDEGGQGDEDDQGVDPEIAAFKREMAEDRFYRRNRDAEGHEDKLFAAAKQYPSLARQYSQARTTADAIEALEALWAISKGQGVDDAVNAAKKDGRKQAAQDIAKASLAGAPKGNATASANGDRSEDEERLERFSKWD